MQDKILNGFDTWINAQGRKSKGRVKSVDNISLEGIARLRELILDLAVRGKLVSQNPEDEPASELLKKITAEKERLIEEGKIKVLGSIYKKREFERQELTRIEHLKGGAELHFGEKKVIINYWEMGAFDVEQFKRFIDKMEK